MSPSSTHCERQRKLCCACRLASVHLVDSSLCSNAGQYISALVLSLNIMMSLELPHINVLSKIDLVESQGDLAFNLEYYSEVLPFVSCSAY